MSSLIKSNGVMNSAFNDVSNIRVMDSFDDWNHSRRHIAEDASYQLTSEEVTNLRGEIQHILRWKVVSPHFITTKNIGKGMLNHEYYQWQNVIPPRLSRDPGERGRVVNTAKEKTTVKLYAMDYDMYISMMKIDAYQNGNRKVKFTESLKDGTLRELTESLAEYREWYIHRGTDIPNFTDIGVTGLMNNASVTDPGALGLGADDNLTAPGDVNYSATLMSNKLITAKFSPPFVLLMTPGVFSQARINKNTTTGVSDMEFIMSEKINVDGKEIPLFESVLMDPFLIDSDTETTTTGSMAVLKKGEENMAVIDTYGFGYYPLPSQSLGIEGKLLWMSGIELRRPTAIVYADALTISCV